MDATLQTDLGGAHPGGLGGPAGYLVHLQQIGRTPEVQRQRALGEPAETALVGTHVRVIDISVGHPRDLVADPSTP